MSNRTGFPIDPAIGPLLAIFSLLLVRTFVFERAIAAHPAQVVRADPEICDSRTDAFQFMNRWLILLAISGAQFWIGMHVTK